MKDAANKILAICTVCANLPLAPLSIAQPVEGNEAAASAATATPGGRGQMSPLDRARSTSTGELKNRYTDDPEKIAAGRGLYLSFCGGCHGGTGGGGMAPPLSNEVWLYGSDDDTLFRLIALGTVELTKQGYTRRATEGVVGPMVPFGHLIKSDADLWKIIAYMRTTYRGRPEKRNW